MSDFIIAKKLLLSTLTPMLLIAGTNQNLALAQPTKTQPTIPSKAVTVNGKTVQVPDFEQTTFDSLPPTTSSGSLIVPQKVIDDLGFDPSTAWVAGQKPQTFLKLQGYFILNLGLVWYNPTRL